MNTYRIRVETRGFEYYEIDAESKEEARENWYEGSLLNSEVIDSWIENVELIP